MKTILTIIAVVALAGAVFYLVSSRPRRSDADSGVDVDRPPMTSTSGSAGRSATSRPSSSTGRTNDSMDVATSAAVLDSTFDDLSAGKHHEGHHGGHHGHDNGGFDSGHHGGHSSHDSGGFGTSDGGHHSGSSFSDGGSSYSGGDSGSSFSDGGSSGGDSGGGF